MLRCERSVGVSGNMLVGFSGVFGDGIGVYQNYSGGLRISVSSWMYNLSVYFNCILVFTKMFDST